MVRRKFKYASAHGNKSHWSGAYISRMNNHNSFEISKGEQTLRFSYIELCYLKEEIQRVLDKPTLLIPQDIEIDYDLLDILRRVTE